MKTSFITLILLFSLSVFAQDGKLNKAKESLKENPTTTEGGITTSTNPRESRREVKTEKPFQNLLVGIAYNLTYGIVVESIFERNSEMHYAEIAPYPYKTKEYGNFTYLQNDSKDYALARLDIHNSFLYESKDLYGNDLDVKFRFGKRFDIEADYLQFIEDTPLGKDYFSMYTTLFNYHRIRVEKLDFWFGLGAAYVGSDVDEFGFAYNTGAEWFVGKPISIFASHKGTSINSNTVSKTKFLLKYYLKKYSFSTGYEYYHLGDSNINAFSLGLGISL